MIKRIGAYLSWRSRRVRDIFLDIKFLITGRIIRYSGLRFDTRSDRFNRRARRFLYRGQYEAPEAELSLRYLSTHRFLVEIGAGIGVISCQLNRVLADPNSHLCVEADPEIAKLLKKNRDLNGLSFKVVEGALGYDPSGSVWIGGGDQNFCSGCVLSGQGQSSMQVRAWTLADLLGLVPSEEQVDLVMDIEGMEFELIEREIELLSLRVAMIIMEVHPDKVEPALTRRAFGMLEDNRFDCVDVIKDVQVWRNRRLCLDD